MGRNNTEHKRTTRRTTPANGWSAFRPPPLPEAPAHEAARERVANMTAEQARKTFVDSGIIDASGKLTKPYRRSRPSDDLVRLLERARDFHQPRTQYKRAIELMATEPTRALVPAAIACVTEARLRDGTKRGSTTRRHWEAAIALARSEFISAKGSA